VVRLLAEGYPESSTFGRVLPGSARLQSCQVSGSTVTVDFSSSYAQLSGIDLTVSDYCIALSLVQIPGIYTVRITVNGKELDYRGKNYFRADDILVTSPEDVVRNLAVQLYFLNGTALAAEERILTIYEGDSQAQAVMDALLAGPATEGLGPLLPEGFSVLGFRVEEGTCYVNLPQSDEELLPKDSTVQRRMVMGVVRSLCSVRGIQQVQFLVEGERCAVLGQVDISQPLRATT
jgi:germination protein M